MHTKVKINIDKREYQYEESLIHVFCMWDIENPLTKTQNN